MRCWCKETVQSKEESLTSGQSRVAQLRGDIESSGAEAVRLASELNGHLEDLKSGEGSLQKAQAQRGKQRESFEKEEKEIKERSGLI